MEKSGKINETDYLMICAYCRRLLKEPDAWERHGRGELELNSSINSHGICPDCLLENFPQEYLAIQEERRVRIKNIFKRGYLELYGHLVK